TQRTEGNAATQATHNWWGSANGPGQDGANGVSDNVTYDPWYTDEEMTTLSNAEEGTDNVDMFNINSEALGKEASMDEEEIEEIDIIPLENAIQAAIAAKEGVEVSEDGADVPAGTYWVTQEDMDALNAAIAAAEAAKESAETQQDVAEAVEALEAAVSTFNDAKQEVIDEEEIGASEEGEEPVQGEELADDEESVEDEEAVEGEEQEE
ncbi:MAG: hypothetical protein GX223_04355, partial [Tepidanaerobacter sp.]|nr:hypothetical protein [Tepidanaerobacter sp.]